MRGRNDMMNFELPGLFFLPWSLAIAARGSLSCPAARTERVADAFILSRGVGAPFLSSVNAAPRHLF